MHKGRGMACPQITVADSYSMSTKQSTPGPIAQAASPAHRRRPRRPQDLAPCRATLQLGRSHVSTAASD